MQEIPPGFRSGFVAIVGKPNVGKSTLLNALVGLKLAIVTPKASTTRRRMLGILNGDKFQAVLIDTPGVILPKEALHVKMMDAVSTALSDADLVLLLVAPQEPYPEEAIFERIRMAGKPTLLVINKCDLADEKTLAARAVEIHDMVPLKGHVFVSATESINLQLLLQTIQEQLPEGPPYYPDDQLTDRTERFLVAELIREQIFLQFQDEIPYNTEVTILQFQDREDGRSYIDAEIHVARKSQKGMLIGKGGKAIKALGVAARKEIEEALERPVFLNLYVRVTEDWYQREGHLKSFGYHNP